MCNETPTSRIDHGCDIFLSSWERLDEYFVADAEAKEGSDPQFGADATVPLDDLAKTIAGDSTLYRGLGGPPIVCVLLVDDMSAADSYGTYIDRQGGGHVAIYDSTPWAVLHKLAHVLTQGQSSLRWLKTYRDLVRERYGDWDAALFEYGSVRRISHDEPIRD